MKASVIDPEIVVFAEDLSLGYGRDETLALNGVSLSLKRGETLGVIGEAGSGKTTLARAIAVQSAYRDRVTPRIVGGRLNILGTELRRASRRQRGALAYRVGYLPQDGAMSLHPNLSVGENIAEAIFWQNRHTDLRKARDRVAALVDAVRLSLDVIDRFPYELSRGQAQRVALARALVLNPELLVADQPTMGVDVLTRGPLLGVIQQLQTQLGFSTIIVSHDIRQLRTVTDKVAVLYAGLIVGYGTLDQVLAKPVHKYVRVLAKLAH